MKECYQFVIGSFFRSGIQNSKSLGRKPGYFSLNILHLSSSGFYLDPRLAELQITGTAELVPYVALVLILLIRPYGLFGQIRIERV